MRRSVRNIVVSAVATAAVGASLFGGGSAGAAVVTGWTGTTGPVGGNTYLHNSTIDNTTAIKASSKMWTVLGNSVPSGTMGIRARLFKSGALCEIVTYKYNIASVASWQYATPGVGCGTGSYNSHGFVSVFDPASGFTEYVTFPSNPLNWTAPAGAVAKQSPASVSEGINARGQTFGSAATAESDADLPDLVAVTTADGRNGFIDSAALKEDPLNPEQARKLQRVRSSDGTEAFSAPNRSVPLLEADGTTRIGAFPIG